MTERDEATLAIVIYCRYGGVKCFGVFLGRERCSHIVYAIGIDGELVRFWPRITMTSLQKGHIFRWTDLRLLVQERKERDVRRRSNPPLTAFGEY